MSGLRLSANGQDKGPAGMPVGVQVIGRRGADLETLRAAQWLGNELGAEMV